MIVWRYRPARARSRTGHSWRDVSARRTRLWALITAHPHMSLRELAAAMRRVALDTTRKDVAALEAGGYIAGAPGRRRARVVIIPCMRRPAK